MRHPAECREAWAGETLGSLDQLICQPLRGGRIDDQQPLRLVLQGKQARLGIHVREVCGLVRSSNNRASYNALDEATHSALPLGTEALGFICFQLRADNAAAGVDDILRDRQTELIESSLQCRKIAAGWLVQLHVVLQLRLRTRGPHRHPIAHIVG